jgi:hypothetical protein
VKYDGRADIIQLSYWGTLNDSLGKEDMPCWLFDINHIPYEAFAASKRIIRIFVWLYTYIYMKKKMFKIVQRKVSYDKFEEKNSFFVRHFRGWMEFFCSNLFVGYCTFKKAAFVIRRKSQREF